MTEARALLTYWFNWECNPKVGISIKQRHEMSQAIRKKYIHDSQQNADQDPLLAGIGLVNSQGDRLIDYIFFA